MTDNATPKGLSEELTAQLRNALAEHYELQAEIGYGATAVVFQSLDRRLHRPVAIKVLRPEVVIAAAYARFGREIAAVASLSHPHIVALYDSGEAAGLPYYVMPLIEGESLRQRLRRERQLPLDDALRITRDVASALQHAHEHGLVHRDVKPENILITGSSASALADFGLARVIQAPPGDSLTYTGLAVGTAAYMSPEQASGDLVDARADQYSLACVMYEMLAGMTPFHAATMQGMLARHRSDPPPRIRHVRESVPQGIEEALLRCMSKTRADRFASIAEFVRALDEGVLKPKSPPEPPDPGKRRRWTVGLIAVAASAAIAAVLIVKPPVPPVEPELLVVAPFDVKLPQLDFWSDGLADLIARNLDGAGPLRAVSPTTVLRSWKGTADLASVSKLANQTGAGLAVIGMAIPSGGDSVRLSAQVFNVRDGRRLADVNVVESQSRMDRAADSLSFRLLLALSPARFIGGGRLASVGSRSLPAIKAFLQGEQFYRGTAWDSALARYQHALDLDSTFALALFRLSQVTGWQSGAWAVDSLERAYALAAGRLNRGLATRDSLVVAAESLRAATASRWEDDLFLDHRRRLFSVIGEATRRYPGDPEVWYQLGLARFLVPGGGTAEETLEAFSRGIRLDSTFAPAYIYPMQLAMVIQGPSAARSYASSYLSLKPTDMHAKGLRLAALLLDPVRNQGATQRSLDAASAEELFSAYEALAWWVDTAETAVNIARLAVDRPSANPLFANTRRLQLSSALSFRGHVSEAFRVLGDRALHKGLWTVLVTLGAVSDHEAARLLQQPRGEALWPPNGVIFAIPWWASQGDLTSLRTIVRRADSLYGSTQSRAARPYARLLATSARAHLFAAAGQTDSVRKELATWDDSSCAGWDCYYTRLDKARLLLASGSLPSAAAVLDAETPKLYYPMAVLWRFERAQLAVQLGHTERAREDFQYVVDAWGRADAQLQPLVSGARKALDELRKGR